MNGFSFGICSAENVKRGFMSGVFNDLFNEGNNPAIYGAINKDQLMKEEKVNPDFRVPNPSMVWMDNI